MTDNFSKVFSPQDRAVNEMIPISMRIGVNRQRINIVTKIHVKESEWSAEEGKLKPKTRDAQKFNDLLDGFRIKAFDCQRELMNEGKPITLENIKAKWFGTSLERSVMLMEVFTQHNEQMKALVNKEFSPLTLERYETSLRHTLAFMKWPALEILDRYKDDPQCLNKLRLFPVLSNQKMNTYLKRLLMPATLPRK